ncbi:MAG: ABC transporter substrate-binding protein [Hyphomonas sp.]|uniref:MlaC/ttg2D family ABC transporter substrate-binding protein n=1 Tax=Hyphomonas sp. TaxID=87 RepID=UPI003529C85B
MFRPLFAAALFAALPLAAHAGPEAEAVIEQAARDIFDPVDGEKAFTGTIDVPTVARFSLGKHARRISADEEARFTDAFRHYLANTYRSNVDKFDNVDVIVVGSIDRSPTDSIVETRIRPEGKEAMTVRWRVIARDGEWRVVDVEFLGLWLAIEQRAQIAAILDRPRATIEDAIAALQS